MTQYSLNNVKNDIMNDIMNEDEKDRKIIDIDMEKIFLEISKNWNELEKNEIIKELVDMKTNNLCKQIKNDNPDYRNSYIQSLVFSFIYAMNLNCNQCIGTRFSSSSEELEKRLAFPSVKEEKGTLFSVKEEKDTEMSYDMYDKTEDKN